jgi:hypothetical protein
MVTSTSRIPRVSLDSSVFFAAAYSTAGSAHDLLRAATEGRVARIATVATYDRKDLLSRREAILAAFGIVVATPGEILTSLL